jgi:dihydrofolate reductase
MPPPGGRGFDMKCSAYCAASLDGFIARRDGGLDWLHKPEYLRSPPRGLAYDEFMATVDALVVGRRTFEKVLSFGTWPYEGTPVVVLSSRPLSIPPALEGKVGTDGGAPAEIVARLAAAGMRHLYVDGGTTLQGFLRARCITELTVTLIPVLLGDGIALFGSLGTEVPLRLIAATPSENGFVQVRYAVAGDASPMAADDLRRDA